MKERTLLLMPKRRMPGCRGAADTAREERVHSVCLQRMTSFLVYTNEIVVSGIGIGYSQAGYSNCYATFWTDERDGWTDGCGCECRTENPPHARPPAPTRPQPRRRASKTDYTTESMSARG